MIDKEGVYIVVTTINNPTNGIIEFSKISSNRVIVVGDKKTPPAWESNNVLFYSLENQLKSDFDIAQKIPTNHYGRKMMGYLLAIKEGANIIVDTDDDNEPKSNWEIPSFEGTYDYIPSNLGSINIYSHFTDQVIWPRGLPLKSILNSTNFKDRIIKKSSKVGVWQGLADGDPDVDAIYRLTYGNACYFDDKAPIVLGKNTVSPFNSQNTIFRKELFPLLYLPSYVTFRFTDILRSLVAQSIMWLYGYELGFIKATVVQKRNEHDFLLDFISEIPMYKESQNVVHIVNSSISSHLDMSSNLLNAYLSLQKHDIVSKNEITLLESWLKTLASFRLGF